MVNPPVQAFASPAAVCEPGVGGVHSCSCTFSEPHRRPRTCPLPPGTPRLPAVGSSAYGEMEDTLGGEQRFKGPALPQAPLARKGPQGQGEVGS